MDNEQWTKRRKGKKAKSRHQAFEPASLLAIKTTSNNIKPS